MRSLPSFVGFGSTTRPRARCRRGYQGTVAGCRPRTYPFAQMQSLGPRQRHSSAGRVARPSVRWPYRSGHQSYTKRSN